MITILFSCATVKKIPVTETVNISSYQAYVFRLCEYRNSYGNKRYFLCDTPCTATDVQANNDIQVVEELYAFQSNTNPEDIIYITSTSDKYIQEDRGIFNDSIYKKYIVVSDFEFVYFGKMTGNGAINFVKPTEKLSFNLKPVQEVCLFVVDTIYSQTAVKNSISNKRLSTFDLFNVNVQFIATPRKLVFSRKTLDTITTLKLKDGKMFFEGKNKTFNLSQKRRLRYHPIYDKANDSIVEKIVQDSLQVGRQLKFKF